MCDVRREEMRSFKQTLEEQFGKSLRVRTIDSRTQLQQSRAIPCWWLTGQNDLNFLRAVALVM
jgi:hypothetical protein